jgi:hypothetical protein
MLSTDRSCELAGQGSACSAREGSSHRRGFAPSFSARVRWGEPDFLYAALTNIHVCGFQ